MQRTWFTTPNTDQSKKVAQEKTNKNSKENHPVFIVWISDFHILHDRSAWYITCYRALPDNFQFNIRWWRAINLTDKPGLNFQHWFHFVVVILKKSKLLWDSHIPQIYTIDVNFILMRKFDFWLLMPMQSFFCLVLAYTEPLSFSYVGVWALDHQMSPWSSISICCEFQSLPLVTK